MHGGLTADYYWTPMTLYSSSVALLEIWLHGAYTIFSLSTISRCSRNQGLPLHATGFHSWIIQSRFSLAEVRHWAWWRALRTGRLLGLHFLKNIRWKGHCRLFRQDSSFISVITGTKIFCYWSNMIRLSLQRSLLLKSTYSFAVCPITFSVSAVCVFWSSSWYNWNRKSRFSN